MNNLLHSDSVVHNIINEELTRQQNTIELIASENIVSRAVMEACGSILTNKYAEGKPPVEVDTEDWESVVFDNDYDYNSLRFYNGCRYIDKIETIACNRFKALFQTDYHVNVQPHSGAQANMAVFEALLNHGDTILSMDLSNGGHLSHGSPVNYSGKHFNVIQYGINENGKIDYDEIQQLAYEHKPKLIICGASNYSKIIDFERFAAIKHNLDEEDPAGEHYVLADIAHIAGLIAGGEHPSPFDYVDVVTTTTHKSLRGPRGGVIACRPELAKKIDSAVFPGIQGGPLEHIIAAKAVCFGEALLPQFSVYAKQVRLNARALCQYLMQYGFNIVGGMTENHLMTVDLRNKNITGKDAANLLDKCGITVNKNTIPNDPQSPFVTSGIRIGTPAITTRGFKEQDMEFIARIIHTALEHRYDSVYLYQLQKEVAAMCSTYPIYQDQLVQY